MAPAICAESVDPHGSRPEPYLPVREREEDPLSVFRQDHRCSHTRLQSLADPSAVSGRGRAARDSATSKRNNIIMTRYLRAKDIAEDLGVSLASAYRIMRECTRLVAGKSVRVTHQAFHAWKERHTEGPCETPFICVAGSGGASSPTRKGVGASADRPAAMTESLPASGGSSSSALSSRRPIVPRTRPRLPSSSTGA